ncbi:MAG: hypothetical protein KJ000_07300 [Pirellulaceae bacterium]|nr:hypothetical protein [Pirellulaceae bacterium]
MKDLHDEPGSDELVDAELVGPRATDRETYNVISDTVTGVNLRISDNVFQAVAILVCLALGTGIGAAVFEYRVQGALVCGFLGLLAGLFGSGIFLMIYRAIRHLRGRHD